MTAKKTFLYILLFFFTLVSCRLNAVSDTATPPAPSETPAATATFSPPVNTPLPTLTPTATLPPTATPVVFDVGEELTVDYLREMEISGSETTIEQTLIDGVNYSQYIASYLSEGNRIYGILTVPFGDPPEGGFKAVVFNHGYIPPDEWDNTTRYYAYADYLARSGFVVFKIDYRGHGNSEGVASGSYFSPDYTIDAIAAFKSLQMLDYVDPQGIGMWGHSMAGNLVLRALLVEPEIAAGVIWAGAVYSYSDLATYGITDRTYRPPTNEAGEEIQRTSTSIFETYGRPDLTQPYWQAISLTENIDYLNSPLQIHHAENDTVVSIDYSVDLAVLLQENGKTYEFYTYEGGGHNITSPYFDTAMARTVEFFKENLNP